MKTITLAIIGPGTISILLFGAMDAYSGSDCKCAENSIEHITADCTIYAPAKQIAAWDTFALVRTVTTNCMPSIKIGDFSDKQIPGCPNPIGVQNKTFKMPINPKTNATTTSIIGATGDVVYEFGITLTGIELDPAAAMWWDYDLAKNAGTKKWAYEALNNERKFGLDCNHAHVQPRGAYHYHGRPADMPIWNTVGSEEAGLGHKMMLIGYAADGFPIYYKYGYTYVPKTSNDIDLSAMRKTLVELRSSYKLRDGCRQDVDPNAPCGAYNGKYTQDYIYEKGTGELDECNGKLGWTEEFGYTYYYIISDSFPVIPRCFRGTPNDSFKVLPPG
jgi:hypothetical protein